MLFFDIETTGFSPAQNQIYCIGCGYRSGSDITIELFFAENPAEEKAVLASFFDLLAACKTVVTFNGNTFDIPFVRKRAALFFPENSGKADPFRHASLIDLYREASGMKHLLGLSSCRQKAIEAFLGCSREDQYDGGQLITIYHQYVSCPDAGLLSLLLLHNLEDIRGMFDLFALLSYRQLCDGQFEIIDAFEEPGTDHPDKKPEDSTRSYTVKIKPRLSVPQRIRMVSDGISIFLNSETGLISFPLYHGTLKHFFQDYENYYYLPAEDYAVHKSVGAFVDSAHRKKATKHTCYVKKECDYLCIPLRCADGFLRREYQDPCTCMALPADPSDLYAILCRYFSGLF
ncbi:MAG: ribonuclease H-like domain-containing protein [Clostridiales bacterium]|nr:ribonuclease H-like domain-containing protein [Clostridiales bacterium]